MARPLRIQYPDAYYHGMNRSNRDEAKQKEIGAIFGVDYSTVSQSRARLRAKLKSSRKLKKQFLRIRDHIIKMSNSKI